MLFADHEARPALIRIGAIVLVSLAFAGCKKEQAGDAASAGTDAATTAAAVDKPAVADKITAMSPERLREAAGNALRQQRLYAPAGDNAMEYYLALRDKQPSDPAVSSALTDLLPYALIATEQSIGRDDYEEAQRLFALLEKADAKHPALARLQKSITDGRTAAAKAAEEQKLADADAVARQAEVEKQRIADQQKAQKEAAEAFARQQEADRQAAAERESAQRSAAAARPQPAAPAPTTAPASQPAAPATQPAATANTTLRPISLPPPDYPREAQRRRRPGRVEVEFTVGTDGTVTSSRVVSASPPRVFDREALSAVNRWRFQPISSPVTTRRSIEFKPAE